MKTLRLRIQRLHKIRHITNTAAIQQMFQRNHKVFQSLLAQEMTRQHGFVQIVQLRRYQCDGQAADALRHQLLEHAHVGAPRAQQNQVFA